MQQQWTYKFTENNQLQQIDFKLAYADCIAYFKYPVI